MNLQQYADFTVALDNSLSIPKVIVSDAGNYPLGIIASVTAKIQIRQPDGITTAAGNPDIIYSGGSFTTVQKDLRQAIGGVIQKGTYTFIYTVSAPGYDDTIITKTIDIQYDRSSISSQLVFTDNVFTPSIKVNDNTSYAISGLTLQSVTRSWTCGIENIATIVGGNVTQLDLKYSNNYFDTKYNVTLLSTVVYSAASWCSIKDKLQSAGSVDAYAPMKLNDIFLKLDAMYIDIKRSCDGFNNDSYVFAFTLFEHFKAKGLCGYTTNLYRLYNDLMKLLGVEADHTNLVIPAYDFTDYCGCCSDSTPGAALAILSQPSSLTRDAGGQAIFGVIATGTGTLSYVWRKNGVAIPGATASSLTLNNVQEANEGNYDVIVTDSNGSIASIVASLTVNPVAVNITVSVGWSDTDPTASILANTFLFGQSKTQQSGTTNVEFYFSPAVANGNYFAFKVPTGQPVFNKWVNVPAVNYGDIPDSVFNSPILNSGGFDYYITRVQTSIDTTQSLKIYV